MTIHTQCQQCQKQHRFRDENAGKKFKCKACGSINQVSLSGKAESEDEFFDGLDDAVKMASEAKEVPKRKTPQVSKKRTWNQQFPQRQGQRKNKVTRLDEILGYSLIAGAVCVFASIVLIPASRMIEDYELATVPPFVFVLLLLLFVAGVIVMIVASRIVRKQKFCCRACGKGELFPIASEEDGTAHYNCDGQIYSTTIPQYYDCYYCGHRAWIEHWEEKPNFFADARDE